MYKPRTNPIVLCAMHGHQQIDYGNRFTLVLTVCMCVLMFVHLSGSNAFGCHLHTLIQSVYLIVFRSRSILVRRLHPCDVYSTVSVIAQLISTVESRSHSVYTALIETDKSTKWARTVNSQTHTYTLTSAVCVHRALGD